MQFLHEARRLVNKADFKFRSVQDQIELESKESANLENKVDAVEKSQEIVQEIAQQIQTQAHAKIAEIVSQCLDAVFEDPYEFKIDFERKRGKTEAKIYLERRGLQVNPMSASGGGVVDVAAFALRLACLVLSKPSLVRVLVLDECFKYLSAEYRDSVRELLEKLSDKMKIQIIMVSHSPDLMVGEIVRIK